MPYFVSGPLGVEPRMLTTAIDGGPSFQDLRDLTTLVVEYYRTRTHGEQNAIDDDSIVVDLLGCKLSPQLALARLYVATLYESNEEGRRRDEGILV